MRHPIDPKIDCVFKALLGAEANRRRLIHRFVADFRSLGVDRRWSGA